MYQGYANLHSALTILQSTPYNWRFRFEPEDG